MLTFCSFCLRLLPQTITNSFSSYSSIYLKRILAGRFTAEPQKAKVDRARNLLDLAIILTWMKLHSFGSDLSSTKYLLSLDGVVSTTPLRYRYFEGSVLSSNVYVRVWEQ